MRFTVLWIATATLALLFGSWLPFWLVMVFIALAAFLVNAGGWSSFFAGGFGMGLTWLLVALWISLHTASPLPSKMLELMGMNAGSGMIMVALTGAMGFLLGSMSAWTGYLFRMLFAPKSKDLY